jgi:ribosomal protein S21
MVAVKNNGNMDPERLIKRFMKKVKKAGIIEQVLSKRYFVKPSTKKRLDKKKRIAEFKKRNKKNSD